MDKKILFICTAYQDTQVKVNHCLSLLSEIKKMGGDVCFATHASPGLEEISNVSDYVVYDHDNSFPSYNELYSSLGDIQEEDLKTNYHFFRNLGSFQLLEYWWPSHNKSAISSFKNCVTIAESRGYEWVVYFEYDLVLPPVNLVEFFKSRITSLESQNLSGYFYRCPDYMSPLIWPMLFTCRTEVLSKDQRFSKGWQKSNQDFLKVYGSNCIEDLLYKITESRKDLIVEDGKKILIDLGYKDPIDKLKIFSIMDTPRNNSFFGEPGPDSFAKFDMFYFSNPDGSFNIELWLVNIRPLPVKMEIKISVYKDKQLLMEDSCNTSNFPIGYWSFKNVLTDLVPLEPGNIIDYNITYTAEGKDPVINSYTINTKDLEKHHLLKRRINLP